MLVAALEYLDNKTSRLHWAVAPPPDTWLLMT